MSTTVSGQTIITTALQTLGAYGVGQTLSASDTNVGLRRLNAFLSSLSIQNLAVPTIAREVFDLVANQGTYTIGVGADFNTARPTLVQQAAVLLTASSPPVEVPIGILTQQAYNALQVKDQTSTQAIQLFYNPTYRVSGWGTIFLWPTPTTSVNDLVLYLPQPLLQFADLTTQYQVPPGVEEMLGYQLAMRLAGPFGRPVEDEVRRLAIQTLAAYKRNNTPMADLGNDFSSIGGDDRYGYNIQTDTIQR